MEKIFDFLRINAIAWLCFCVAFWFWKDYFEHPHQLVTQESLVRTTGKVKAIHSLISLPSGYHAGYAISTEDPEGYFSFAGGNYFRMLQSEVPEGSEVTIAHSPEVDPRKDSGVVAFSITHGGKEFLSETPAIIASYNAAITKKLKVSVGTTLGGFAALGLVWAIRKKLAV